MLSKRRSGTVDITAYFWSGKPIFFIEHVFVFVIVLSRSGCVMQIMWKGSAHRLRRTFYFAESFDELSGKGAFEMRHSFLFPFVGTHFLIFSRTFLAHVRWCTHLLKSQRDCRIQWRLLYMFWMRTNIAMKLMRCVFVSSSKQHTEEPCPSTSMGSRLDTWYLAMRGGQALWESWVLISFPWPFRIEKT